VIARRWVALVVIALSCGWVVGRATVRYREPCALTVTENDVAWFDGARGHDFLRACSADERAVERAWARR